MRRRLVSVLLAAAMAVTTLAGCGGSSGTEKAKKEDGGKALCFR